MPRRSTAERLRSAPPVVPDGEAAQPSAMALSLRPIGTPAALRDALVERRTALLESLPRGVDLARFQRTLLVEAQRTPKLLECSTGSLIGAALIGAQLGLEPGPLGKVYLIPRWNSRKGVMECQFLVGYRGYCDLAMRDERVIEIDAEVVHQRDVFAFRKGLEPVLRHEPRLDGDPGPVIAGWCMVRLAGGGTPFVVLSRAEIDARRERSAAKGKDTPWETDYDAMARKSAVRALMTSGTVPMSVHVERAMRVDEAVTSAIEPALVDTLVIDAPVEEPATSNGGAQIGQTAPGPVGTERMAHETPAGPPGNGPTHTAEPEATAPPPPAPSPESPAPSATGDHPAAGAPPAPPQSTAQRRIALADEVIELQTALVAKDKAKAFELLTSEGYPKEPPWPNVMPWLKSQTRERLLALHAKYTEALPPSPQQTELPT